MSSWYVNVVNGQNVKYKSFSFPGHLLSEILLTSTTSPQII